MNAFIDVQVNSHIFKPVAEVFDAIVNPNKITGYFVSDVHGEFLPGNTIIWEFKDYNVSCDVEVKEVVLNESIAFDWSGGGRKASVFIKLDEQEDRTNIDITESSFEMNEEGIKVAMQQNQGWTDFICSLKAYLYTGVNLRNGKMSD